MVVFRSFPQRSVLALVLLLAACQQPTTYGPRLSPEELAREEQVQAQMVRDAAKMGGAPRPWRNREGSAKQFTRVADRIDKAVGKVCQEMGLPEQDKRCYYYFQMSRDSDLNSHADGRTVVIYSGMMRFLENDDEVAIIMGHELAHNMMGHVDASQDNAIAGAVVGALIDGVIVSQGGTASNSWMNTGAQVGAHSYSVEFEEEADYVGLYIAARAGYDIRKAPGLWRRMSVEEPRALFTDTTHPSNPKRSAQLQKAVEEIQYKRKHHLPLIPDFKNASQ